MVSDAKDAPQAAPASDIPEEFRIRGIEGVRSYCEPDQLWPFAQHLGFQRNDNGRRFELRGETRSSRWYFASAPDHPYQDTKVGVWHHISFDAGDDLAGWRDFGDAGPVPFTKVYDHYLFDSCYSPSAGGLVELASYGPGFLLDQKVHELGQKLALSPRTEPLRSRLERELTPLVSPRDATGALVDPHPEATF
jgi:glyoxalase family protein